MGGSIYDDKLAPAISAGHFDGEPPEGVTAEKRQMAKEWNTALREHGVLLPSGMKGVEALLKLKKLHSLITLSHLWWPVMLRKYKPEDLPLE